MENLSLQMVLVPQTFLDEIMEKIESLQEFFKRNGNCQPSFEWIESDRARKMLDICPKTWQTYRNRRIIPFSQFGRKMYVNKNDLNKFMEEHKITSRV